ncbi:MAG: penicillin-binding transpeptidase domain-containing protein, partial [Planctomycetota bacterium]|nr:penicillin-binding transpeptidase domain-containing protein [Planctomycetota bacterium]
MRPPSGQTEHGITPFQVRLLALGLLALGAFATLGWQLGRLTADETWRNDARAALRSAEFLPTTRGPILDRDGRPLAVERPSWSFQVHYETLSGDWAFRQARRDARRAIGVGWSSLSGSDRHGETIARLGPWEDALAEVWETLVGTGLDRPELLARTENIRDRTGRLLASVWRRRFERLIEQGYDDPEERFRMEPIAEQRRFYTLVDGLDQDGAFPLLTAIDRLDRLVRESDGDPARDPAFRIQGESRRDRGFRQAVVELDRSTLPGPLRANDPLSIEVVGVADTLIGTTRRRITEEDERERPLLDPDDPSTVLDLTGYDDRHPSLVGSSGIEREFDRRLHGSIGFREENIATSTALRDIPPIAGESVQLAIDGDLQARVQAILDPEYGLMRSQPWQYGWRGDELREMIVPEGTPLHGAVVVLDVETGETLALVSTPTVADLDLQPRDYELLLMPDPTRRDLEALETQRVSGLDAAELQELEQRIDRMQRDLRRLEALPAAERGRREQLIRLAPFRNRAIATEYAPGSIVKPLVYLAGVEGGRIGRRQIIQCDGYVRGTAEQNLKPRCWIFRPERGWTTGHGPLDPVEAIAQSCNVYFYRVADELGPVRLGAWYRDSCGLGDRLGPGFGAAAEGTFRARQALGEIDRMIVGIG